VLAGQTTTNSSGVIRDEKDQNLLYTTHPLVLHSQSLSSGQPAESGPLKLRIDRISGRHWGGRKSHDYACGIRSSM
jgi:hypothetical protein